MRALLQIVTVLPESADGGALLFGAMPDSGDVFEKRNIGAAINLSGTDPPFDPPIEVYLYDICQPFEDGYPLAPHRIDDMLDFIHEHRACGSAVLVFCRHGLSASAFIVACYLKQVLGCHATEVWDRLRAIRPSIRVHERYKAIWDTRYGVEDGERPKRVATSFMPL